MQRICNQILSHCICSRGFFLFFIFLLWRHFHQTALELCGLEGTATGADNLNTV